MIQTTWSPPSLCHFIATIAVLNIFNCVFTLSFFLILTLDMPPNQHSLLATITWLIINSLLTLTVLVSAFLVTHGFIRSCQTLPSSGIGQSCRQMMTGLVFDQLIVASVCGWVLLCWLVAVDFGVFMRVVCIVEDVECEVNEYEVLMVRYARILRRRRRVNGRRVRSLSQRDRRRLGRLVV